MVNKRLLELAERQKNPSLPDEKTQQEKAKTSNLVHILERDENGKPKITLNELKKTAINTPTQEEYNTLIQVYECGDWRWWGSGDLPTHHNYWNRYKEEACVRAKNNFAIGSRSTYYRELGHKIILTQEFYDLQKPPITPEMINEINKWFEKNG